MFCPNCGHKVEGMEKFCPQCGAPLGGSVRARKGGSSRWLKIAGTLATAVLVVVLVAVFIGKGAPYSSPESVVSSFHQAFFEKEDAQQVLALIDPQLLAEAVDEYELGVDEIREEIQASIDSAQEAIETGALFSFRIGETTRLDGEALTEVVITTNYAEGGDDEHTLFISTVERDGRWYLAELPYL